MLTVKRLQEKRIIGKQLKTEEILQAYQDKYHVLFRDQSQVRKLIEYIIAKIMGKEINE